MFGLNYKIGAEGVVFMRLDEVKKISRGDVFWDIRL